MRLFRVLVPSRNGYRRDMLELTTGVQWPDGTVTVIIDSDTCAAVRTDGIRSAMALVNAPQYAYVQWVCSLGRRPEPPPVGAGPLASLRAMALGMSQRVSAKTQMVAEETVKSQLQRGRRQLGAANGAHAAALVVAWGLVDPREVVDSAITTE